ncbi:MAG: hypothetical protein PVG99_06695, partial [Desulfobacteraceae bacterium]
DLFGKEGDMKKTTIAIALAIVMVLGYFSAQGHAQMGPGMMGHGRGWGPGYGPPPEGEWNYCPYCGSYVGPERGYGMGPGMMGPGMMHHGRGMGPGMRGPGYGMGPGMMGPGMMHPGYGMGPGMRGPGSGYGSQYQQPPRPLEEKDAQAILEDYLKSTRNPNLKVGKIEDKGPVFEAEIVTKEGSLVDKLAVDKNTGWMRSIY